MYIVLLFGIIISLKCQEINGPYQGIILNRHNQYRSDVARGLFLDSNRNPIIAADMNELIWDNAMAAYALEQIERCDETSIQELNPITNPNPILNDLSFEATFEGQRGNQLRSGFNVGSVSSGPDDPVNDFDAAMFYMNLIFNNWKAEVDQLTNSNNIALGLTRYIGCTAFQCSLYVTVDGSNLFDQLALLCYYFAGI